jgi:membrane-associated phospholipid phosphatase
LSLHQAWPLLDRWFPNRGNWSRPTYSIWLLGVFVLLGGLPYTAINRFAAWRDTSVLDVETGIDLSLPFVPWMALIYASFYAYFPVVFWMGSLETRRDEALWFTQRLIQASWIAFALFILLPVKVDLRHQVQPSGGLVGLIMDALYVVDQPYNAWPSLHVLQSVLVVLMARHWLMHRKGWARWKAMAVWGAWVMLCLSTLLVKQHYLFDVITATVLGAWVWRRWCTPPLN